MATTAEELLSELWNSRCPSRRYLDGEEKFITPTAVDLLERLELNSSTAVMVRVKVQQQATPKSQVGNRAGTTGKKASAVSKAADNIKQAARGKGASTPTCNGCGILISNEVKAFQCDKCQSNSAWRCIDCANVKGGIYDEISEGGDCELQWICEGCNKSAYFGYKFDMIVGMIEKLMDRNVYLKSTVEQIQHEMTAVTSIAKEQQPQHEQYQQLEEEVSHMVNSISERIDKLSTTITSKLGQQEGKGKAEIVDTNNRVEEKVDKLIGDNE